jgi:hypothetical protein
MGSQSDMSRVADVRQILRGALRAKRGIEKVT